MATVSLAEFIHINRSEILDRCFEKARSAEHPAPAVLSRERGIPLFLDQLVDALSDGMVNASEMEANAREHGRELFNEGFSVGQLVHDYGSVCQAITDLAVEADATMSTDDFRTLNRCLDDAIAVSVAEYASRERCSIHDEDLHIRNLSYMALTSFEAIRAGTVGVAGATGELLLRTLRALNDLSNPRPH